MKLTLILRSLLVLVMVIASMGVTIKAVACTRMKAERAATCPVCTKNAASSAEQKNCCKTEIKHLSVKSDQEKPSAPRLTLLPTLLSSAVLAFPAPNLGRIVSEPVISFTAPPIEDVGTQCARTSTFRI